MMLDRRCNAPFYFVAVILQIPVPNAKRPFVNGDAKHRIIRRHRHRLGHLERGFAQRTGRHGHGQITAPQVVAVKRTTARDLRGIAPPVGRRGDPGRWWLRDQASERRGIRLAEPFPDGRRRFIPRHGTSNLHHFFVVESWIASAGVDRPQGSKDSRQRYRPRVLRAHFPYF